MDFIRLPKEETVYEREAVLGRDASSVFPKEAEKAKREHLENIKEAVGLNNSRFITESQLEALKKERGPSLGHGDISRDKTLAAILAENKAKKDEQFSNIWKTMKQGKNRPLDDEEMDFVNTLVAAEASKRREQRQTEEQDIAAFHEAVQNRAGPQEMRSTSTASTPVEERPRRDVLLTKPLVKIKPSMKGRTQRIANLEAKSKKRNQPEPAELSDRLESGEQILEGLLDSYGSEPER